jgi:hypothetical protein
LTFLRFLFDEGVGIGEGLLQTFVQSLVASLTDSLLLAASFGVFLLEGSKTVLLGLLESLGLSGTLNLGVWVKFLHGSLVLQWVLLGRSLDEWVALLLTELALNLIRVDDSGKISAGHHASVECVATLLDTSLSVGTEDFVQVLEGISSEDDESTEVTTWSKLQQVKSMNAAGVDTWEIACDSLDVGVLVTVDNEWTLSHLEAGVSHLVETGTGSLAKTNTLHVCSGTNVVETSKESLGGINVQGVNNKWELWNLSLPEVTLLAKFQSSHLLLTP